MTYMISGAGAPNFGDELILKNWLEFLDKQLPNEPIIVETTSIKEKNLLSTITTKNAQAVTYLREIAKNNKNLSFWEQVQRGWNFGLNATHEANNTYTLLYSVVQSCTRIHLIGGGYMHQRNKVSAFILGAVSGFAKRYNKPLYATGLGMQPMEAIPEKYKFIARKVFTQFNLLEVRDKESYEYLMKNFGNESNFIFGLDDSFVNNSKKNSMFSFNSPTMHISCGEHALNVIITYLQDNLEDIKSKYDNFIFWECAPRGDKIPYIEIKKLFPRLKKISINMLLDNGIPFQSEDYLITSRFHPHLMFSRLGGKGTYVAESKYYKIKHQSVLALGSNFILAPRSIDSKFQPNIICLKEKDNILKKKSIIKLIYKI